MEHSTGCFGWTIIAARPDGLRVALRRKRTMAATSRLSPANGCQRQAFRYTFRRIRRMRDLTPKRKRNLRLRLLEAQNNLCWICHEPMDQEANEHQPLAVTFDHIVPLHDGGRMSARDNFRLAHRRCNMKRGNETAMAKRKRPSDHIAKTGAD